MHATGQKAHGMNHLHIGMFIIQHCYWLIIDHEYKPP